MQKFINKNCPISQYLWRHRLLWRILVYVDTNQSAENRSEFGIQVGWWSTLDSLVLASILD